MDALRSRSRFGPVLEWLVAALFLGATVAVSAMIVTELRAPVRPRAALSTPTAVSLPAAIPPGAVSVPVLPFSDGKEMRLGESLSAIATRFGRAAERGKQEVDRGVLGDRLTRFYEYSGTRFIVVFEPFERDGEARVAAIFRQ